MGTARSVSASWLLRVSRPGTPLSYRPHTRTPSPAPAPAPQTKRRRELPNEPLDNSRLLAVIVLACALALLKANLTGPPALLGAQSIRAALPISGAPPEKRALGSHAIRLHGLDRSHTFLDVRSHACQFRFVVIRVTRRLAHERLATLEKTSLRLDSSILYERRGRGYCRDPVFGPI